MTDVLLSPIRLSELEALIQNSVERALSAQRSKSTLGEPEDKLLTVEQAADFLDLTVPTIYAKTSKGELPFMKRSKRLYFSREELMAYLKQGRHAGPRDPEPDPVDSLKPRRTRA